MFIFIVFVMNSTDIFGSLFFIPVRILHARIEASLRVMKPIRSEKVFKLTSIKMEKG